jgi:hypothetical protein
VASLTRGIEDEFDASKRLWRWAGLFFLFNRAILSNISCVENKCLPKLLCNAGEPGFARAKQRG